MGHTLGRSNDLATYRAQDMLLRIDNLRFPHLLLVVGQTGTECDCLRRSA